MVKVMVSLRNANFFLSQKVISFAHGNCGLIRNWKEVTFDYAQRIFRFLLDFMNSCRHCEKWLLLSSDRMTWLQPWLSFLCTTFVLYNQEWKNKITFFLGSCGYNNEHPKAPGCDHHRREGDHDERDHQQHCPHQDVLLGGSFHCKGWRPKVST